MLQVKTLLSQVVVPKFEPKGGIRIKSGDTDETPEGSDDDDQIVEELLKQLEAIDKARFKKDEEGRTFDVAQFEKDNDENFHVAFMTSTASLPFFCLLL